MPSKLVVTAPDLKLARAYFEPRSTRVEVLQPLDALLVELRDEDHGLEGLPPEVRVFPDQALEVVEPLPAKGKPSVAPRPWKYEGKGVGVAILGGGVAASATIFGDRLRPLPKYPKSDATDEHTTHVAEVLGGSAPTSAAPAVTLYSAVVKSVYDVTNAVHYVNHHNHARRRQGPKIRVIYMSMDVVDSAGQEDALAFTAFTTYTNGMVMCVPAGNFGPVLRSAMAPHAITVGGSFNGGTPENPADDTWVAGSIDARIGKPNVLCPDGAYPVTGSKGIRGTSPASAYAAGFLAALFEAAPNLTPAGVFRILAKTSQRPINDPMPTGPAGWYGAIDFLSAIALAEKWPQKDQKPSGS